jgi:hypothetical protein
LSKLTGATQSASSCDVHFARTKLLLGGWRPGVGVRTALLATTEPEIAARSVIGFACGAAEGRTAATGAVLAVGAASLSTMASDSEGTESSAAKGAGAFSNRGSPWLKLSHAPTIATGAKAQPHVQGRRAGLFIPLSKTARRKCSVVNWHSGVSLRALRPALRRRAPKA